MVSLDPAPDGSPRSCPTGESKWLQNNPPDLVPTEDRAARHVVEALTPFSEEQGGPLRITQARCAVCVCGG